MKKPVLFATDFSRLSLSAFPHAVAAARREKAERVILHVLPPPVTGDALQYVPAMMYEQMKAAVVRQAEKKLEGLRAKALRSRVRARQILSEGLAANEILRSSRALGARLVVLGTHGRSGLTGLLLGSVAMQVIGGARCPVMTVRSTR